MNCPATSRSVRQQGFTLVELLVVIVIMSIFAAVAVGSISGVAQRQLMQQREQLINDLAEIRLESMDQGKVLALLTVPANATQQASYLVAEYKPDKDNKTTAKAGGSWQPVASFKTRSLQDGAFLQVKGMDSSASNPSASEQDALKGQQVPDLIWYGNGEVKPARLQLFMNDQPVGDPVYVNSAGMAADTEDGS